MAQEPAIVSLPNYGDGTITISFFAPPNTGGYPIDYYIVYYTYNGQNYTIDNVPSNQTSYTYTDLQNGEIYEPYIVYVNTRGDFSPQSFYLSVSPSATPQPPQPNIVNPPTSTRSPFGSQITITFSAPEDTGGSPIDRWAVYTLNGTDFTIIDGSISAGATSFTIQNLPNGYTYTVYLYYIIENTIYSVPGQYTPVEFPAYPISAPNIIIRPLCGDQSITIYFSPPAETGGAPIDYYRASLYQRGNEVYYDNSLSSNLTEYTFTDIGLENGIEYQPRIEYVNTGGVGSPQAIYRTVAPGVQSEPPYFNTLISLGSGSSALSVVIPPSNTGSALAKWLLTTLVSPTTGQQQVFTIAVNDPNTQTQSFRYLQNLTEPWYRWYAQAQNDPGKSYQPPGNSNLNYYNFPMQYTSTTSSLKVWIDGSMMTPYTNNQSLSYSVLSNFAPSTPYTFIEGSVDRVGVETIETPTGLKFRIATNGDNYGGFYSSNITEESQLNDNEFTLVMMTQQLNNALGAFDYVHHSRFTSNQYVGCATNIKRVCSMDGTPFVTEGIPYLTDYSPDMFTLTRNSTTQCVSFGYNGSTISTSGIPLSTLNDLAFCVPGYTESQYTAGRVYEVMYYNRELPMSNQQSLEGYLAWKWGVNSYLPPNHPYANTPP